MSWLFLRPIHCSIVNGMAAVAIVARLLVVFKYFLFHTAPSLIVQQELLQSDYYCAVMVLPLPCLLALLPLVDCCFQKILRHHHPVGQHKLRQGCHHCTMM